MKQGKLIATTPELMHTDWTWTLQTTTTTTTTTKKFTYHTDNKIQQHIENTNNKKEKSAEFVQQCDNRKLVTYLIILGFFKLILDTHTHTHTQPTTITSTVSWPHFT